MGCYRIVIAVGEQLPESLEHYATSSLAGPLLDHSTSLAGAELAEEVEYFCPDLTSEASTGWALGPVRFGPSGSEHVVIAAGQLDNGCFAEQALRQAVSALPGGGAIPGTPAMDAGVIAIASTTASLAALSVVLPVAARVLELHSHAVAWTESPREGIYVRDAGWVPFWPDLSAGFGWPT